MEKAISNDKSLKELLTNLNEILIVLLGKVYDLNNYLNQESDSKKIILK